MKRSLVLGMMIAVATAAAIIVADPGRAARDWYIGAGRVGIYHGLLAGSALFAWRSGGAPERIAALVVIVMAAADPALHMLHRALGASVDRSHLINDAIGFGTLFAVALYANRFWPMWMAALLGQPLFAHLTDLVDPTIVPRAYYALQVAWTYLALIVLAVGAYRYRNRLHTSAEADWYGGPSHDRGGPE